MIQLKYASPRIGEMTVQEVEKKAGEIMLKIHVITGWEIPQKEFMIILREQCAKKLLEDYPQLNPDEIEYAFRSAGTVIEDWGKTMNLNLIDKVLIPYTEKRYDLSKVEEVKKPVTQKLYSDEELKNIQRGDVEACYQRLRNGRVSNVPDYFKEILWVDKLLLDKADGVTETVDEFFVRKLNSGAENIYRRG